MFFQQPLNRVAAGNHQQRVTIRHGFGDEFRREIAACAGAIVDNHGLPETLGKFLPKQTPHGIVAAARREADDHANGFGGVGGGGLRFAGSACYPRQRYNVTYCFY